METPAGRPGSTHYYLLEEGFTVWLLNAAHVKNVPGRKTDLLTELPGRILVVGGARAAGWLGSALMVNDGDVPRELSRLVVPLVGSLEATGDLFEPFRLIDGDGVVVGAVTAFFAELQACGRPATTQRSYGMDLLRWFRFLWAVEVGWDQATRVEARDFCRWLQVADKPARPHWRYPAATPPVGRRRRRRRTR